MPFPGLWGRFNRILMVKKQRFSMWFLQWVSLANTVLPTEIIICRFADEWGGVPPPHTPPVAPPLVVASELSYPSFSIYTNNIIEMYYGK